MSPMEITLLIIGVVIFLVSFLIKDSEEKSEEDIELQKEEIRNLLSKEIAYFLLLQFYKYKIRGNGQIRK